MLRNEGLRASLMQEFTGDAGRPPAHWAAPAASEQSWLRRLWPVGRTSEAPAVALPAPTDDGSVIGTVIFPEAPPRP